MRLDSVNSRDAHSGDGRDKKNILYTVVKCFFGVFCRAESLIDSLVSN